MNSDERSDDENMAFDDEPLNFTQSEERRMFYPIFAQSEFKYVVLKAEYVIFSLYKTCSSQSRHADYRVRVATEWITTGTPVCQNVMIKFKIIYHIFTDGRKRFGGLWWNAHHTSPIRCGIQICIPPVM